MYGWSHLNLLELADYKQSLNSEWFDVHAEGINDWFNFLGKIVYYHQLILLIIWRKNK